MQYWLVKQEPTDFSWTDFVKEGSTAWTGVRNFQARNNLRAMKKGDPEKINKRKDKLAESRKELQDALDEIDK